MGHAGTLDPLATGLMIVGVGEGTKRLAEYLKLDKEYEAEILLGESRTTGDMEGEVIETAAVSGLSKGKVAKAVASLEGTLSLRVSAYSAIKKDGVPMYKRARQAAKTGEVVPESELPLRDMKVLETEFFDIINDIETDKPIVKVRFKVGSGAYIRSLAEELGRRLGYPAVLKSLRRTKIGDFSIEDASKLDDI